MSIINPLTTDDERTCHVTLAARYQFVQYPFQGHTGFALAKEAGIDT